MYNQGLFTYRNITALVMPRTTNTVKWKKLIQSDDTNPTDTGVSNWKSIEDIEGSGLKWSKNGNQRHGKFFGLTRYNWESRRVNRTVVAIRTVGFDEDQLAAELLKNRPISKSIYSHFKGVPCVACGSTKSLVVDHKNDLYNDSRVHRIETQTIDDFQSLCNACNLAKRAYCSKTKKTGVRQAAPHMCKMMGGQDFIEGDSTFDPTGLGLRGTFWYDVVAYFNRCKISKQ